MIRALISIFLLCLITSACTQHLIFGKCSPYSKPGSVCKK